LAASKEQAMTKNSGGVTINRGGASTPTKDERDSEFAGVAGNAAEKGEKPSPAARDRGEVSSADDSAPVDLDFAHDRAS
jgi:hypothetical protein